MKKNTKRKFLNNDFPRKEDMIFISVNGMEIPKEGYEEIIDEDGYLIGKGNFKNGVRYGFWQFFYRNGKIDNCGYYGNDGLRLSINKYGDTWNYYYENGSKIGEDSEECPEKFQYLLDLLDEDNRSFTKNFFKQDD